MSSGFRLHSQSEAATAAVVGDVLSLVVLGGDQCPPPHQLSGGEGGVVHDQEEAMAVSHRIAVMHQGVIVQRAARRRSTSVVV